MSMARKALFDDTSDLKRGHIPPDIRLRSEPMDPDNSFGHGLPLTASSRSASGKQRKLVCELTARRRLLGVLCRRRVHDTARAVAVHVNRARASSTCVPPCATAMGQRALLSTAQCHCVPPRSCTSPSATALHRACRRMLPSAAAHHGVSWPRPPSAHTAASNALYSAWHRVAPRPPSHTKCQLLHEWRPVLQSYRAPPSTTAVCCAASHASQY